MLSDFGEKLAGFWRSPYFRAMRLLTRIRAVCSAELAGERGVWLCMHKPGAISVPAAVLLGSSRGCRRASLSRSTKLLAMRLIFRWKSGFSGFLIFFFFSHVDRVLPLADWEQHHPLLRPEKCHGDANPQAEPASQIQPRRSKQNPPYAVKNLAPCAQL